MLRLTSGPLLVVEIGLAFFCLVDCLLCAECAVRWLPRWGWALGLLAFPVCGTIAWLVAGHPWRRRVREAAATAHAEVAPARADEPVRVLDLDRIAAESGAAPHSPGGRHRPTPAPAAAQVPDLALARELLAVHEEHERTLRAWEADLLRREAALREGHGRGQQPAA